MMTEQTRTKSTPPGMSFVTFLVTGMIRVLNSIGPALVPDQAHSDSPGN